MGNLSSPKLVKEIINKYGFHFNKGLGQNFLIDGNILHQIINASEIDRSTGVIEIGPGIGVLTQEIAEKAGKVIAIELDSHLIPILKETLSDYDNVKIINDNALKVDMKRIINDEFKNMQVKVVANLPYYITTPIVMKLLEDRLNIHSMVIMVQKEVADRMVAKPGGKNYGALSVAVQYFTQPRIVTVVQPHSFIPQPKVSSTVIKLDLLDQPLVKVENEERFFKVVKAAFGQRRKTLVNAITNSKDFKITKEELKEILIRLSINENQRGETLSIMQFAALSDAIF